MALTGFQRDVIRLISSDRQRAGEAYLAGGATLNALIAAPRISEDLDLFHDTAEAVHSSFENDRDLLRAAGMAVAVRREWETFVEAVVERGDETTRLQWALDSAFRFFPLVEHKDLGLSLHPFDLATNKVLALVGRAEPRDWVDVIECDRRIQPLGYLAWAAAGKDPGLNPSFILEQAARSGRYTEAELAPLAFEGERPTAASLAALWKTLLLDARALIDLLPAGEAGKCVCQPSGDLVRADAAMLREALNANRVLFHPGSIRGAFPRIA